MSEYLHKNIKTSISKTIFAIRSKTFDVKEYNPWKYRDGFCVKCPEVIETMEHFVACKEYGETLNVDWFEIFGNNMETQIVIGEFIEKRYIKRKEI